jgi:hypothetical protein
MLYANRTVTVDLTGTSDGLSIGEHLGTTVFLLNQQLLSGQSCTWHLDVTDGEGRTASDQKTIIPM